MKAMDGFRIIDGAVAHWLNFARFAAQKREINFHAQKLFATKLPHAERFLRVTWRRMVRFFGVSSSGYPDRLGRSAYRLALPSSRRLS
jgi:hypothetical protein